MNKIRKEFGTIDFTNLCTHHFLCILFFSCKVIPILTRLFVTWKKGYQSWSYLAWSAGLDGEYSEIVAHFSSGFGRFVFRYNQTTTLPITTSIWTTPEVFLQYEKTSNCFLRMRALPLEMEFQSWKLSDQSAIFYGTILHISQHSAVYSIPAIFSLKQEVICQVWLSRYF